MSALTERDRLMIAVAIRAFVARDIERRGIADTYKPAVLGVSAYDLIEFADEMLHCDDGDNVEMVTALADGIAGALRVNDLDDDAHAEVDAFLAPLQVLARLDDADPREVDRLRAAWGES